MTLRTSYLTTWTPEKVQKAADEHAADGPVAFANYCQQELGVAYPTQKDLAILRKKIKELFTHEREMDYYSLCRIVTWAKNRKKKFSRVWMVVECFRDAKWQGALPELDRGAADRDLEAEIAKVLETETRPAWRRRLMGAAGNEARQRALEEWADA